MPEDSQEVGCHKNDDNQSEDLVNLHDVKLFQDGVSLSLNVVLYILEELGVIVIIYKSFDPLNIQELEKTRDPKQLD